MALITHGHAIQDASQTEKDLSIKIVPPTYAVGEDRSRSVRVGRPVQSKVLNQRQQRFNGLFVDPEDKGRFEIQPTLINNVSWDESPVPINRSVEIDEVKLSKDLHEQTQDLKVMMKIDSSEYFEALKSSKKGSHHNSQHRTLSEAH